MIMASFAPEPRFAFGAWAFMGGMNGNSAKYTIMILKKLGIEDRNPERDQPPS